MKSTSGGIQVREVLFIALPALALLAGAFWLAFQFVEPGPPNTIAITTGLEAVLTTLRAALRQAFGALGHQARGGPSKGSVDNVERLRDPKSGVQLGSRRHRRREERTRAVLARPRLFGASVDILIALTTSCNASASLAASGLRSGPRAAARASSRSTLLKQNTAMVAKTKRCRWVDRRLPTRF